MNHEPGFRVTSDNGFHITFKNGRTVSVQFGSGNYCEHHNDFLKEKDGKQHSKDAEIAGFGVDNTWLCPDDWDDVVAGWKSPDEVLEFMNWVASQ